MQDVSTDSRVGPGRRLWIRGLCCALIALSWGCGDMKDDPVDEGTARVGEACMRNTDCGEGLLCKGGDLRCVRLCEIGSDDCGEGIVCEPANDGTVGFCPLPPA